MSFKVHARDLLSGESLFDPADPSQKSYLQGVSPPDAVGKVY
jgi:hypothetical protein